MPRLHEAKKVSDRVRLPPANSDNNARNLRSRSGGAQQSIDDAVVATRRPLHGRMDSQSGAPVRMRAPTPTFSSSGQSSEEVGDLKDNKENILAQSTPVGDFEQAGATPPVEDRSTTDHTVCQMHDKTTQILQVKVATCDSKAQTTESLVTRDEIKDLVSQEVMFMASTRYVDEVVRRVSDEVKKWVRDQFTNPAIMGQAMSTALGAEMVEKYPLKNSVMKAFGGDLMTLSRKGELSSIRKAAKEAIKGGQHKEKVEAVAKALRLSDVDLDAKTAATNEAGPSCSNKGQGSHPAVEVVDDNKLGDLAEDLAKYSRDDLQKFKVYLEKAAQECEEAEAARKAKTCTKPASLKAAEAAGTSDKKKRTEKDHGSHSKLATGGSEHGSTRDGGTAQKRGREHEPSDEAKCRQGHKRTRRERDSSSYDRSGARGRDYSGQRRLSGGFRTGFRGRRGFGGSRGYEGGGWRGNNNYQRGSFGHGRSGYNQGDNNRRGYDRADHGGRRSGYY